MIKEIRADRFNAVLAWHPDRLSRNAGDLGAIVDLMDQKKIVEVRTYQQKFTNNPSEKFLFMILGSQAKLENDNKSVNVKRGLRTRCEMGLWPAPAPTGYANSTKIGERGVVYLDPKRAPVIRKMFEKIAYEDWSGRKLFYWLRDELKFTNPSGKPMTLSNVYLVLRCHFYYGKFEYPRGSNKWYQGKHEPVLDKPLFDLVQEKMRSDKGDRSKKKQFAFTHLMQCGICGSGVTALEKFKKLSNGTIAKYIYYTCTRFNDKECPSSYIREEELISELEKLVDTLDFEQIGMKEKIRYEIERYTRFQTAVLGQEQPKKIKNVDLKAYAKYVLRSGTIMEKREVLESLKSKIIFCSADEKGMRLKMA
jgi:hypothetical protein